MEKSFIYFLFYPLLQGQIQPLQLFLRPFATGDVVDTYQGEFLSIDLQHVGMQDSGQTCAIPGSKPVFLSADMALCRQFINDSITVLAADPKLNFINCHTDCLLVWISEQRFKLPVDFDNPAIR